MYHHQLFIAVIACTIGLPPKAKECKFSVRKHVKIERNYARSLRFIPGNFNFIYEFSLNKEIEYNNILKIYGD